MGFSIDVDSLLVSNRRRQEQLVNSAELFLVVDSLSVSNRWQEQLVYHEVPGIGGNRVNRVA